MTSRGGEMMRDFQLAYLVTIHRFYFEDIDRHGDQVLLVVWKSGVIAIAS